MSRWPLAVLLLPLVLQVGCTARDAEPATRNAAAPFAHCDALAAAPAGTTAAPSGTTTGPTAAAVTSGTAGQVLPDIELACFAGGQPVPLRALRGPALLNLWASWCGPCRKELPAFQRFAERAGGQVHVIGVNTRDDRDAAQSLAEDFGLTFPNLFDPTGKLRLELARTVLPMTLFVDGQGRIRHLDATGALDDAALGRLVARHLGVTVPA